MCVYLYIIKKYTQQTHILCNIFILFWIRLIVLFWMRLIVWQRYLRYKIIILLLLWITSKYIFPRLFSDSTHDSVLKPYGFKMEEIEGFRYRCRVCSCPRAAPKLCLWLGSPEESLVLYFTQDAMRSVTKQAVKEARLKEIKQELLNSEKLKVRHRFVLSSSSLMSNNWLSLIWCVTDVLWRQSQRPAATATRQRPSSRRHQTSPEKRARLPG